MLLMVRKCTPRESLACRNRRVSAMTDNRIDLPPVQFWTGRLDECVRMCVCISAVSHPEAGKFSHRSCNISLFCFFHCSLKSVENSCQMEKKVFGETSFSPAFGLTENDMLNSKKLRAEKKNISWRPKSCNTRLQKNPKQPKTYSNCCKTQQSCANMQNMKSRALVTLKNTKPVIILHCRRSMNKKM